MRAIVRQLVLLACALACTANAFAGSISLAWDAVNDPRLAGYKVYYGTAAGTYTGQIDVGNITTRTVSNLVDGAVYYFAVTAYDASRVESTRSNEVSGVVPFAAPVANFTASATTGTAPLSLNFTSTSTGTINTYAWVFGDGTTSSAQNPVKTYSSAGSYTVSLTVTGPGGSNTRTTPNFITVTSADPTPPTVPGSLVATPSSSSTINLSWTASTDNVGVTGYRVERCTGASCTSFAQIATPVGTTYSNTGLTAGTTYRYRVRATDAAGNLSSYSAIVSATTPVLSCTGLATPALVAATGGSVSLAGTCSSTVTSASWTRDGTAIGSGLAISNTLPANSGTQPIVWTYQLTACNGTSCASPVPVVVVQLSASGSRVGRRDFDGNGRGDLLWRNSSTGHTLLWLMNGGSIVTAANLRTDPAWSVTLTGDFNGDGRTDLVWRNAATGETVVWLMSGAVSAGSATMSSDASWRATHVGDFNSDGRDDIVWRNSATGATRITLMNGTAIASTATMTTMSALTVTHVADFDANGTADLVWYNATTGETVIWLMNGTSYADGGVVLGDPNWTVTHAADFDADGRADLVWRNSATGATALWLMNGEAFAGGAGLHTDPNWRVTHTADLNGDGRADLVWRNAATGETAAWLMSGAKLLSGSALLPGPNWNAVRTEDTDGNSRRDIVWRNAATGESVLWLMNGSVPAAGHLLSNDPNWAVVP